MKAFGQIIKSLFILRYLDEVELRQAIEKQLKKVELANRFTRAIAVSNPREFTEAEKEKQKSKDRLLEAITTHSVISWAHINLLGEYDFSDEKLQDSVGILLPKLAA